MLLKTNIKEAVSSLYATRQRSLLALIGIVIGIGSVIALVSVGSIAKFESLKQYRELGTDILTIRRLHNSGQVRRQVYIRLADALDLADRTPSIVAAAPWTQIYGPFMYAGQEISRGEVLGVRASFADLTKLSVSAGRFISDLDFRRYYCVVGHEVAQAMRQAGATRVVGDLVKLGGHPYTVVGVLRPTQVKDARSFNADRGAFVPMSTAQRAFDNANITMVIARMRPDVHHTVATREVESYFRQRSKDLAIQVISARQLIQQMEKQSQLFTLLLGVVGSISLIVGGIGVMNIMLVSVTERRKEIGIRRALGAKRKDIQSQFLIESILLSLLGGLFGLGLGLGSAYVICQFSGWTFMLSVPAMLLGVGVASGVGIFFGFYPAHQAAQLNPVTALRAP